MNIIIRISILISFIAVLPKKVDAQNHYKKLRWPNNYVIELGQPDESGANERMLPVIQDSYISPPTASSENDTLFTRLSTNFLGVRTSISEWGDYDNDGDLDVIISGTRDFNSSNYGTFIYQNQGDGNFELQNTPSIVTLYQGTWSWADYDSDGDLDLFGNGFLVNGAGPGKASVLYQNVDGQFIDTGLSFALLHNSVSKWADMDNDGDMDLVLSGIEFTNTLSAKTIFYLNDNNGTFSEQIVPEITGAGFGTLLIEDFDGDMDNDVMLIGDTGFGKNTGLFQNLGNLNFEHVDIPELNSPLVASIDAGDFDNDGDLDLLVGSRSPTRILENTGGLNFSVFSTITSLKEATFGNVKFADMTNDGLLDILINGWPESEPQATVYVNDGNSDFIELGSQGIEGLIVNTTEFADFDNDGDLDLITTGSSSSEVITVLYENNISRSNTAPTTPGPISSTITFDDITLSWSSATDDITEIQNLTYNYYLGTTSGSFEIGAPLSDLSTGYRKVAERGSLGNQTSWTFQDLPIGQYYFGIQAVDDMYKGSAFTEEYMFEILEKDAPNAPVNPMANGQSATSTLLNWEDASEDEIYFKIERSITGESNAFDSVGFVLPDIVRFLDTSGLSPETIYYYRIVSVGDDGKEGVSEVVSTTTLNALAPAALTVDRIFPDNMTLVWSDQTNDEVGFLVERSTDSQDFNFVQVEELGANSTEYFDDDLSDNFPFYRVGVRLPDNSVLYSNVVEIEIPNYFSYSTLLGIEDTFSNGAAWGDFDNDGDADLVLGPFLYENLGDDLFSQVEGIEFEGANLFVTWGDHNNDGWLDLLSSTSTNGLELLVNNGDGSFTDFPFPIIYFAREVMFADFDNDGYLDIFGVNFGSENIILQNDNGIAFQRMENDLTEDSNLTAAATIADVNNDLLPDVFLANRSGPDFLYLNQGDFEFEVDASSNLTKMNDLSTGFCSFGHLDNDGEVDVILGGLNGFGDVEIYKGDPSGGFALWQSFELESRSASWADIDNDGDMDIIAGRGLSNATMAYVNDGTGLLSPVTFGLEALDFGVGSAVSTADYDLDGDLDLLVAQRQDGTQLFYKNNNSDNNWIQFRLQGHLTNKSAVGAKVKIKVDEEWAYNEVSSSNGNVANSFVLHFGLKKQSQVDSVVVLWPSGTIQSLSSVNANQILEINEIDVLPPEAPSCLFANRFDVNQSRLSWVDNSSFEDQFIIERSTDNLVFQELVRLESNVETFEDTNLNAELSYFYRIYAENDNGQSDTIAAKVAPIVLGENIVVCEGEQVVLDAGPGFSSYLWNDGSANQSLEVSNAGIYTVTVTDPEGCIIEDEIQVTFNENPVIDLGEDVTSCDGENLIIDAGPGFTSYQWSTGATTQAISVVESGIYSVTVSNAEACSSTDEIQVTFVSNPTVDLGEDITSCEGEIIVIDAGPGFSSYQWSTGATTQAISVAESGTYGITVSNAEGCSNTDEIHVLFNENPIVDLGEDRVISDAESTTLNAGSGFVTYQWSSGETTESIEVTASGAYSVTVIDQNGCEAFDVVEITFDLPLSIPNDAQQISIYPNPVTNKLVLRRQGEEANFKITIISINGQKVYDQETYFKTDETFEIDLTDLRSGIYMLQVNDLEIWKIYKK